VREKWKLSVRKGETHIDAIEAAAIQSMSPIRVS
jgi:hypothetical protein